jgi:hypothetical protein
VRGRVPAAFDATQSAPEQKSGPLPASTTTRSASSVAAASSAAMMRRTDAGSSEFLRDGRLSVMRRTPSRLSIAAPAPASDVVMRG